MRMLPLLFKHEDVDERIRKEQNKVIFKTYIIMQIIAIISISIIIVANIPWYNLFASFIVLVVCNLFLLIKIKVNALTIKDLFNKHDECMYELKNKFFNESYGLGFFIILIAVALINMYSIIFPLHSIQSIANSFISINLITIMVPGAYFSLMLIRKGLILSKTHTLENKNANLRKLRLNCLLGGIIFGVLIGLGSLSHTNIKIALLTCIACGAFWGISFYIIKRISMKISEKNANKNL